MAKQQKRVAELVKQAEDDFNMAYVMVPEVNSRAQAGGLFRNSAAKYLRAYLAFQNIQKFDNPEDTENNDSLLSLWQACVDADPEFNNILEGIYVLQRFPAVTSPTDHYYLLNKEDLIQAREATGDISLFVNHKLKE